MHRASRPLLKTKTMLVVADCQQAVVLKTFLKTIETIETIETILGAKNVLI